VPSEKRARKRAARDAKLAELERQRKRRTSIRRGITVVIAVGIAIGIFALLNRGSHKSSSSTTTTTTAASAAHKAQATANATAVAAGCPSNPATKLSKPSWSTAPALTVNPAKTYTAIVKTDAGTFDMALDAAESPTAVNSFVFLAQHGFFNCVIFHRVIPGFVIQGGDPTGTGSGGPGYQFAEAGPAKSASPADQYPLYSVAMANSDNPATTDPKTNGSQFFIVTGAQGQQLPPDYVLFGKVTSGTSVVQQINKDGSQSGVPPTVTHRMLSVTIQES
jgi:peptidyl-prolyl cis-trans isomerase B (cyclophilin B)